MIDATPGIIEVTDTKKFCDYSLVETSIAQYEIRKQQFEEDWNDEHPIEVAAKFQDYSDTNAIGIFLEYVKEQLSISREGK